jgi:hypothetical protein
MSAIFARDLKRRNASSGSYLIFSRYSTRYFLKKAMQCPWREKATERADSQARHAGLVVVAGGVRAIGLIAYPIRPTRINPIDSRISGIAISAAEFLACPSPHAEPIYSTSGDPLRGIKVHKSRLSANFLALAESRGYACRKI